MPLLPTHLLINNMTHCHSDLHARPLNVVEVQVMEHRQPDGADGQPSCIAERLVESPLIIWIITFKVPNHLPQDDRLDHFNHLLLNRQDDHY